MSAGTGMGSGTHWLSFQRVVDIPFEACVAALESWRREGCGGALPAGRSRWRGPVEHDQGSVHAGSRFGWPGDRCARCCA
jgi:hypothetical protein